MKRKRRTWRDLLTKKQREHLRESGIRSAAGLRRTLDHQRQRDDAHPDQPRACWDCYAIWLTLAKLRPDVVHHGATSDRIDLA